MKSFLSSILFLVFISSTLVGQKNIATSWSKTFGYQQSFIENKGQFVIPNSFGNPSPVLFAVDHGGTKIYFTKKGITYAFLETTKKQKDANEIEREREEEFKNPEEHARHEKEEHQLKVKADQVTMLWQNANPNAEIVADEVTTDYHSYYFKQSSGEYKNVSNIKGFKKITYKNIYPNIDIDYVFHKKGGLEYSLTLHPGANPSQVKMLFDSHVDLNNAGEIRISSKFGDIIDHAPLTFYQNNNASVIASSFTKTGKTVSFQLANYDNTKTVVIDPWTQTPAFASNWNCVWECEKDGAGNVYMIGGVNPMQLLKYNSSGTLQWTFNTPYDSTSWLGTMATDLTGNSYVTLGSLAKILKVNSSGSLIWSNNIGTNTNLEFWSLAFNCNQTNLIAGGSIINNIGSFSVKASIFSININTGAIIDTQIVAYSSSFGTSGVQEIRAVSAGGNDKYYFLTFDTIGYINQKFSSCVANPSLYKINSTYAFDYKCENYRLNNSGIMAIRANENFVYTQNGTHIHKRSLITGAILATAVIPGGGSSIYSGKYTVSNSGIDIDDCGNVYVGSTNAVIKYDANLNLLSQVSTIYKVYDIQVTTNGDVIVCGSTGNSLSSYRSGYVESINMSACSAYTQTCCSVTCINQLILGNNHATIYPNPNNGEFNIDYAFELGGQEIVLIDILGKEVKYFDLENTKGIKKINISDLSNGVYIYKIQNKNGVLFSGKINLNK
jgi:hypothetical protein